MSRQWSVTSVLVLIACTAFGCGAEAPGTKSFAPKRTDVVIDKADNPPNAPQAGGKPGQADEQAVSRKIIYSANLDVQVEDVEAAQKEVEKLVEEVKGYIAKSEVIGNSGSKRTATWTIKVPAEKFRSTVTAFTALGKPLRNTSDSQDVTEEFVDVQARVKNLKAEEETLNKLLREAANRMEDFLKVREQIKNIRGDIERAEGRMKFLTTMAAMSSIVLTVREEASYVPPVVKQATPFQEQVETTFTGSWNLVVDTGKSLTLIFVSLAPWLPVIIVGLVGMRWMVKSLTRYANTPITVKPLPQARRVPDTGDSVPTI